MPCASSRVAILKSPRNRSCRRLPSPARIRILPRRQRTAHARTLPRWGSRLFMIGAIRRIPSISLQPCAASRRANANGQVLEQAVAAVGSLDQRKLGDYLKTHSFDTIVGKIEYASNGEWKNPRVL